MDKFVLKAPYQPTGDQPQAIAALVQGFREGNQFETLLGVTGSGKTFTMANVIQALNKPTLILSPTTRPWRRSSTGRSRSFFPITQWSILSPTTTTISRKPMCLPRIPILPRIRPLTTRSTSCGCPPRRLYPSAGTWWWWPACPAFSAWDLRTSSPG